jgi:hypothetical protein
LRLRVSAWIVLFSAYCFFASFGYARNYVPSIVAGELSPDQAIAEITGAASNDWFTPEHSEFAGPYLSLLVAVSGSSEKLLGSSYYESLLAVLPRFMYPGEKPLLVSAQFAEQMHQGTGTVSGWGYNPVAEAFVNFGALGVVLMFVLWTMYFLFIRLLRRCGEWGVLAAAVLLAEAINVNRIDFHNVYSETVYLIAGLLLTGTLAVILKTLLPRLKTPLVVH